MENNFIISRQHSKPPVSGKRPAPTKISVAHEVLQERFGDSLKENEPLSRHTSFEIGGPADLFVSAESADELLGAIRIAKESGLNWYVLGGGSNILVGDDGVRGLVIKNECREYLIKDEIISVQTGLPLDELVDISLEHSLSGLEFAAGIWGTVGGAICGNAGAFGSSISELLIESVVYTCNDKIICVDNSHFDFRYRHSVLKTSPELVLSATLGLTKGNSSKIGRKIKQHRELRRSKHPVNLPSAGSFFKNLENPASGGEQTAAGWFLDQVGARECRVGDAGVFEKHANIFVNHGHASAGDVVSLAFELRKRVSEKFGLDLQMEVRPVGDFGSCRKLLSTLLV